MSGATSLVRRSLIGLWDCAAWAVAVALIVGTRYEFYLSVQQWNTVFLYVVLACAIQLVVGALLKLYRGKYRVGSFEESLGLLLSMVVVALSLIVTFVAIRGLEEFPRGIALLAPPFALVFMAAGRWAYRAWTTSKRPAREGAENVLIYGAGDAGYQLLRLIEMDTSSPYRVVGLIDDDPRKRHLNLLGREVLGGRADIVRRARERNVTTVILAISAASKSMIAEVADIVEGAGMKFLLLPPLSQILGRRVKLSDVKEVDIADILGRRQIHTDIESIAGYLTDKRPATLTRSRMIFSRSIGATSPCQS